MANIVRSITIASVQIAGITFDNMWTIFGTEKFYGYTDGTEFIYGYGTSQLGYVDFEYTDGEVGLT